MKGILCKCQKCGWSSETAGGICPWCSNDKPGESTGVERQKTYDERIDQLIWDAVKMLDVELCKCGNQPTVFLKLNGRPNDGAITPLCDDCARKFQQKFGHTP